MRDCRFKTMCTDDRFYKQRKRGERKLVLRLRTEPQKKAIEAEHIREIGWQSCATVVGRF